MSSPVRMLTSKQVKAMGFFATWRVASALWVTHPDTSPVTRWLAYKDWLAMTRHTRSRTRDPWSKT